MSEMVAPVAPARAIVERRGSVRTERVSRSEFLAVLPLLFILVVVLLSPLLYDLSAWLVPALAGLPR